MNGDAGSPDKLDKECREVIAGELRATEQQKHDAFEWLRKMALGELTWEGWERDQFNAAVALSEWANLKADPVARSAALPRMANHDAETIVGLWVDAVREKARELGLADDESKGSTHDWRYICQKIDALRSPERPATAMEQFEATGAVLVKAPRSNERRCMCGRVTPYGIIPEEECKLPGCPLKVNQGGARHPRCVPRCVLLPEKTGTVSSVAPATVSPDEAIADQLELAAKLWAHQGVFTSYTLNRTTIEAAAAALRRLRSATGTRKDNQ